MRKLFSYIIILIALFSFNAIVVADGEPIEIGFEHSTIKAEIGKPVSVNYYISGGNGDFTIKYTWEKYVNENWILVNQPFEILTASSGTLSYTPDEGTQVRLWMHAEDSTGRVSEGYSATIRVFGDDGVDPIVIDITLDRTELRLGETISATYSVTGGNGQYTSLQCAWGVYDGGLWCMEVPQSDVTQTMGTISYAPSTATQVKFWVCVEDSDGRAAEKYSEIIDVTEVPSPNQDILIVLDKTEVIAGETITATFEKTNEEITILNGNWFEKMSDGSGSSPARDIQDAARGTSTWTARQNGTCRLEISYRTEDGVLHMINSEWVSVHGYEISVNSAGSGGEQYDPTIESEHTLTVDYEITGGYDDFKVVTSWWVYFGMDSSGIVVDQQESTSRTGKISFTPTNDMSAIAYEIKVLRNESAYLIGHYGSANQHYRVIGSSAVEYYTDNDIIITLDKTEVTAGDTVTAAFEKINGKVTILNGNWYEIMADGSGSSPARDIQDAERGTSRWIARQNGACRLEISYRSEDGVLHVAKSSQVTVHGYEISVTTTGSGGKQYDPTIEAEQTLTVDYEITGGYDDFKVVTSWRVYFGTDSSGIVVDQQESTSRTGTVSFTPTNDMSAVAYEIRVLRNESAYLIGNYGGVYQHYRVLPKPDMVLPSLLKVLESEAFSGTQFSCIVIPETVQEIQSHAFDSMDNLSYVYILNQNVVIGDDAFGNTPEKLTFYGYYGSTAYDWARTHGCVFRSLQ